jgi:DNA polymerase-1
MQTLNIENARFILCDFEFRPRGGIEGNPLEVICMVALDINSKQYFRYWSEDLYSMPSPPFDIVNNVVFVAYYASAELSCFESLGWQSPEHVLDLYAEFRNLTNGLFLPDGRSLLGALKYFSIESINAEHKDDMRMLALRGGPYKEFEKENLLDYCQTDVDALYSLLLKMKPYIDFPRALLRGQYNTALARMESLGSPIDYPTYKGLCHHWEAIKTKLIEEVDERYGVYENGSFKEYLFQQFVQTNGIKWPRLESGKLKLDDETFKTMSKIYPIIQPLRSLRDSLSKLRLNALQVGEDGRNRCLLSPFSSTTGRNQPSTNKFVFGLSKWARGLIQPRPGMAIAYIDWSQQEFGIAAALSNDTNMKTAYQSGDPYLAFAKQAGAVPQTATKQSHPSERDQYKQCVLATQYGMGAEALAVRLKQPTLRAKQLLAMHRRVYKQFWDWSDNLYNLTINRNRLNTVFGWQLIVPADLNPRSVRNFPMQANAAEMLRIACILMVKSGIQLCAPIHDAVLIEATEDTIEAQAKIAQQCMEDASQIVLENFKLTSEVDIIRHPGRFLDESAEPFWNMVIDIYEKVKMASDEKLNTNMLELLTPVQSNTSY